MPCKNECCNLHFTDEKLGAHSSQVPFPRMQSHLDCIYVNAQTAHQSQLLLEGPLPTPGCSRLPFHCASISTGTEGKSEQENNTEEK